MGYIKKKRIQTVYDLIIEYNIDSVEKFLSLSLNVDCVITDRGVELYRPSELKLSELIECELSRSKRRLKIVNKDIQEQGVGEECPYIVLKDLPKETKQELTQKLGKDFEQEINNNAKMNNIPYKDNHAPWYLSPKAYYTKVIVNDADGTWFIKHPMTYNEILEMLQKGELKEIFC
jgi:hypothetical protein